MGELRDQMDRDMTIKNLSVRTRQCYLACVREFVVYHRRNPRQLGEEEIKSFLHYLVTEKKASQSKVNQSYSALKFFYEVTLKGTWNTTTIPRGRQTRKLPVVLSTQEVESILSATANFKYKTIFATIYSAGLRMSEGDGSGPHRYRRPAHDDCACARARAERTATRCFRSATWSCCWLLAPGAAARVRVLCQQKPCARSFQRSAAVSPFGVKSRIAKKASIHTLRHSFATHLLEAGCDVLHIQKLLGHRCSKTTSIYLHVQRTSLAQIGSPLDHLDAKCLGLV